MAGLFDRIIGDTTTKDEAGMTEAQYRAPIWGDLIKAGLLAVAGGQNIMPSERARYIAAAGGALGDIPTDLMGYRAAAAQTALRQQQVGVASQELAREKQMDQYVQSPEFQTSLSQLPPGERLIVQGAAMKRDWGTVQRALDPSRFRPKIDAQGYVSYPNGWIGYLSPWTGGMQWVTRGTGPEPTGAGAAGPSTPTPTQTLAPAPAPAPAGQTQITVPATPPSAVASQLLPPEVQDLAQQTTEQPVNQAGQPLLGGANWNQAAFDRLPASMKPLVQAAAEYRMPLVGRGGVTSIGVKGRALTELQQAVQAVTNNTYRAQNFNTITNVMNQYTPGGKVGSQLATFNILHGHIGELYDAFKDLNPGSAQWINQARNYAMTKAGDPEATVADLVSGVVGGEAMKGISGHLTDAEKAMWAKPLSSFNSPQQMQAVINSMYRLVDVRDKVYTAAWNDQTKGLMPKKSFILPELQARADQIRRNPLGGAQAQPGPSAAAPIPGLPRITTKDEFDKLPSGSSFMDENGKRWTKP